ncbi:MAG: aspartyl protease family protein [Candidatus Zixiibacteriota bacterium]
MARPIVEVEIEDKKLNAILDTGSHRSYIRAEMAEKFPVAPVREFEVRLGGESLRIKEGRLITGMVKDTEERAYLFSAIMFPVGDLGEENGKKIDILLGAVVLEDWGAVIDDSVTPPKVDYRILRKGELTELQTTQTKGDESWLE